MPLDCTRVVFVMARLVRATGGGTVPAVMAMPSRTRTIRHSLVINADWTFA